jgi:hypothetical protein
MLKPKSDIIAASPIVTEGSCQPYRVVIRDLGHEFVVHSRVLLEVSGDSFIWGHYFQKDRRGASLRP